MTTTTGALDARKVPCTSLALYVDASGDQPLYYNGERMVPIEHYADEIARRGQGHVFGCSGIYPTGYGRDGSPRYDGDVCRYGDDGPTAA